MIIEICGCFFNVKTCVLTKVKKNWIMYIKTYLFWVEINVKNYCFEKKLIFIYLYKIIELISLLCFTKVRGWSIKVYLSCNIEGCGNDSLLELLIDYSINDYGTSSFYVINVWEINRNNFLYLSFWILGHLLNYLLL